jgi:3D (Asp-Asp-Asp) domain-containing protein
LGCEKYLPLLIRENMPSRLLILIVFLLVNVKALSQTSQADFNYQQPENLGGLKKLMLWSTQYFVHQFKSGGSIPIVYRNGKPSGLFADACDFCEASLQGTAYITDGDGKVNVVKYAKSGRRTFVDCRKCEKYSGSEAVDSWGKSLWIKSIGFSGALRRYKLIPFRSIAVDRKVIPYGTVIYIPKAKGDTIELPNGIKVIHDGYFFAADTGGLINNNHIDLFTGVYSANPFPEIIKSSRNNTFDAFIVSDKEIINSIKSVHKK